MDKTTLRTLEITLNSLANEIARRSLQEARAAIKVEPVAEQCELDVLAAQRDIAVQSLDRNARRLRDVRAALERIRNGSYGSCLECDAPISARRLRAVPEANYCLGCQQSLDHQPRSFRLQWAA